MRIWYDHTPASLCGLHAAAALLEDAPCQITVVETPELETKNGVTRRATLGERGPTEMGALLQYERPLPDTDRHALAARWRSLQAENAPLRAEQNHRLTSVPAGFYDAMILSKAPANEIMVAQLIGKVLAECRLGISDQLIYRRIEHLKRSGKFLSVQPSPAPYQEIIRRA